LHSLLYCTSLNNSNADNIDAFSALEAANQARELLMRAIQLDPNASEGAAFVTLGSLYYMVPGWPIAYGDTNKADALLKKALVINPNTIDANYFYGDFLATQGKQKQAVSYFSGLSIDYWSDSLKVSRYECEYISEE
jgi:Tfp pilus assembly protein PilF